MKAVRKEGVRERTRLEEQLAACDDALAKALRELTILNLGGARMERTIEQPQRAIERLTREKQALREESTRLKSTRTERAQGSGAVPVIRRMKRLITKVDPPRLHSLRFSAMIPYHGAGSAEAPGEGLTNGDHSSPLRTDAPGLMDTSAMAFRVAILNLEQDHKHWDARRRAGGRPTRRAAAGCDGLQ